MLLQKAVTRYVLASLTTEAKRKVRDYELSQNDPDKIITEGITLGKRETQ